MTPNPTPSGRCEIDLCDWVQNRYESVYGVFARRLRESGFPMPWSIYESAIGVYPEEDLIKQKIDQALKRCGAKQICQWEEIESKKIIYEWR